MTRKISPAKDSLGVANTAAHAVDKSGLPEKSGKAVGRIRQERTQRILAAAEEVFAEAGFEGATTALIAKRAGLPKANLHYYFPTKEHVYKALIASILTLWLKAFDDIRSEDDPSAALTRYIHAKIEYSRVRPYASRVFANELIRGAPVVRGFLARDLRKWVQERCRVFNYWADAGKMKRLSHPEHLFFIIWAATQTYADFQVQVAAVMGKKRLQPADFEAGATLLSQIVIAGCGIAPRRKR